MMNIKITIKIQKMLLQRSKLMNLCMIPRFLSSGESHPVRNVIKTKHNPNQQKQLRGHQQMQMYMGQYQKDFFYILQKERRSFSLYNLFSHLPNSITNNLAKLVADPKVTLASDQIYLPRITENGVPVYETLGRFSHTLRVLNKLFVALPVLAVTNASMPFIMLTGIALHYFLYFKDSYGLATQRLVIKMELLPETEQLIIQKVTKLGGFRTFRVRTNDIEMLNTDDKQPKLKGNLIFERSVRNYIDLNMAYRVKSTGQILMFDREGIWHEEGLKHELMP